MKLYGIMTSLLRDIFLRFCAPGASEWGRSNPILTKFCRQLWPDSWGWCCNHFLYFLILFTFKSYLTTQPLTSKFFAVSPTHTEWVNFLLPNCVIVKFQTTLPSTFLLILNSDSPLLNGLNHTCLSTHKTPSTSACDEFILDYFVLLCLFPSPFLQSICGMAFPLHFNTRLSHSFWKYFDDLRLIYTKLSLNYINNQNPLCSILK